MKVPAATLAATLSVLSGLPQGKPKKPEKEMTERDYEKLRLAQEKRDRKAAKRLALINKDTTDDK